MKPVPSLARLLTVASLFSAAPAAAHIQLMSPTNRYVDQKNGPCGKGATDARTNRVTVFEPGATITVTWRETIGHPGHYRISFDADGQDDFADPPMMQAYYSNPAVLLDQIPDQSGTQVYSVEVTLPDVECENCTLQVVQVMYDKPPYTVGGNDLYYQCADLALRRSGPAPDGGVPPPADAGMAPDAGPAVDAGVPPLPDAGVTPADAGTAPDAATDPAPDLGLAAPDAGPTGLGVDAGETPNEDSGGCSSTGGSASASSWLLLLALALLPRRARRLR